MILSLKYNRSVVKHQASMQTIIILHIYFKIRNNKETNVREP